MTGARHGSSPARGWLARMMVAALAAIAVFVTAVVPQSAAYAQQRPRTVLEMLFGNQTREAAPPRRVIRKRAAPRKQRTRRSRSSSSSKRTSPSRAPAAAAAAAPDKNDTAQTVLVVGDFMADSLAKGLSDVYADNADVKVKARANGSSGLVREDYYNWRTSLGPIMEEEKPAVVVVMIGSNDRQQIDTGSGSASLRSDAWVAEYQKRIAAIAGTVKEKGVPLVWVGVPSFKFDRMSEDMIFLNDLYSKGVASVSGEFVDVWDGFVDANGGFVYSGPGVSGQKVQLRGSDGITMTGDGADKLAFFAERAITKRLRNPAAPGTAFSLSEEQLPNMQLPPISNAANAVNAAPVALDDPSLDGADRLLGAGAVQGFSLEPSPRDRLVLNGNSTGNIAGRADDFAWNEKRAAVSPGGPPIAYRGSLDLNKLRENDGIEPPEEMPSILDAIIEDWSRSNDAASGTTPQG
ncbi:MAG: SGNH family hydrolase [Aurantimonas coralicida]|uniref:SGNH/GDSL hydrolase family protein n=1 Tax=Aurantimonas TaxID=182269 RepID=UPI000462D32A|nr:SGNH family hydrolase [Aurantimonas coralicida]